MIASGMQTIVMDSNKTATVACKTIPTWNLESEMSAEAAGLSIPYEVSDPDSVGWRLESDADWIAVDSDVVIDVNTNPSSSSRTGHVSLICDAVETNYVVATCTVMQAAGAATELDPSISVLQDTFSVPATTTSVTQLFSSKNLTGLTATVTGALEGATVNLNEVSRTIVVNFRANTTSSERVSTVTVTGTRSDGKGTYSKSFTITQAAASEATVKEPSISLEFDSTTVKAPTTEVSLRYGYENLTNLTAAVTGTLKSAATSFSSSVNVLTVRFLKNTSTESRTGTVTLTGTRVDGLGTFSKSFTITQKAPEYFTLTVNVTPSDASIGVIIDGTVTTYTAGMAIAEGADVTVSVHKDGYKDSITRFTITENKEIDLVLETE